MKRTQVFKGRNIFNYLVSNFGGYLVDLAAVENTMANGGNFLHVVDDLALTGGQHFNDCQECLFMGGKCPLNLDFLAVSGGMGNQSIHTDSLTVALCQHMLAVHINQLIFQR